MVKKTECELPDSSDVFAKMLDWIRNSDDNEAVNFVTVCAGAGVNYKKAGFKSLAKDAIKWAYEKHYIGRVPGTRKTPQYVKYNGDTYWQNRSGGTNA